MITATSAAATRVTDAPSEPKVVFDVWSHARNLSLDKRDIPLLMDYDGASDLYSGVQGSSPVQVPLDQEGIGGSGIEVGIPSSRFRYFDKSEFNVVVRGLRGCTSVVVVSRLGKPLWSSAHLEANTLM